MIAKFGARREEEAALRTPNDLFLSMRAQVSDEVGKAGAGKRTTIPKTGMPSVFVIIIAAQHTCLVKMERKIDYGMDIMFLRGP